MQCFKSWIWVVDVHGPQWVGPLFGTHTTLGPNHDYKLRTIRLPCFIKNEIICCCSFHGLLTLLLLNGNLNLSKSGLTGLNPSFISQLQALLGLVSPVQVDYIVGKAEYVHVLACIANISIRLHIKYSKFAFMLYSRLSAFLN